MNFAQAILAAVLAVVAATAAAEGAAQPQVLSAPEQASLAKLVRLIDARLALMPDVARHKWNSGAPVADPERERRIVDDFKAKAAAAGLPPELAGRFLTAQIEAAKVIQSELFAAWRQAGAGRFEKVPDLVLEIRPRLDALTPGLLQALVENRQLLAAPLSRQALGSLAAEKTSPAAAALALAPLLQASQP